MLYWNIEKNRKGRIAMTHMIPWEVLCQLLNLVLIVGIVILLVIAARRLDAYTRKNAKQLAKLIPFPRRRK